MRGAHQEDTVALLHNDAYHISGVSGPAIHLWHGHQDSLSHMHGLRSMASALACIFSAAVA